MAAINFDDYGDRGESGSLALAINWAGAALSVLLIVGLASWGWKLWQRDVSGIPVVRALEGPMRIAPAEPGGVASEYQGLSVNRIAEERVDEVVQQVVLAPAPTTLNEGEDLAMSELAPAEDIGEPLTLEPAPAFDVETPVVAQSEDTGPVPSATDMAVAAALSDIGELTPTPASLTVQAGVGVPVTTPRPIGRPAGLKASAAAPMRNDATGMIDPSTIAPGTRLIQLGAYGSPEIARAEWQTAQARFGDYMVGKDPLVQEAETAGRKFWRLRMAGFDTLPEASRFCAVLVSDGANCIPVVQE